MQPCSCDPLLQSFFAPSPLAASNSLKHAQHFIHLTAAIKHSSKAPEESIQVDLPDATPDDMLQDSVGAGMIDDAIDDITDAVTGNKHQTGQRNSKTSFLQSGFLGVIRLATSCHTCTAGVVISNAANLQSSQLHCCCRLCQCVGYILAIPEVLLYVKSGKSFCKGADIEA